MASLIGGLQSNEYKRKILEFYNERNGRNVITGNSEGALPQADKGEESVEEPQFLGHAIEMPRD